MRNFGGVGRSQGCNDHRVSCRMEFYYNVLFKSFRCFSDMSFSVLDFETRWRTISWSFHCVKWELEFLGALIC